MEQQPPISQQSVAPKQVSSQFNAPPLRSNGNKFFLIVFAIFILAFTGAAGYLFGYQQGSLQQTNQKMVSNLAKMKEASSSAQTIEVTKKTKIAKSLTVPKLDPELHWRDITKTASNSGLNEAMGQFINDKSNFLFADFPSGRTYISTGAAAMNPDYYLVDKYYISNLQKSGWVVGGKDIASKYLTFRTFRMLGELADGTCGGRTGYLGYKDSMVRLVSISHTLAPCFSLSEAQKYDSKKISVIYSVFISDPASVTYFLDYFKTKADITISPSLQSTASGHKK